MAETMTVHEALGRFLLPQPVRHSTCALPPRITPCISSPPKWPLCVQGNAPIRHRLKRHCSAGLDALQLLVQTSPLRLGTGGHVEATGTTSTSFSSSSSSSSSTTTNVVSINGAQYKQLDVQSTTTLREALQGVTVIEFPHILINLPST